MTLIKQYVQAMLNQDSVALSKLFSPTAIFVDYCPKDAGQPQLQHFKPLRTAFRHPQLPPGTASCSGGLKSPIP